MYKIKIASIIFVLDWHDFVLKLDFTITDITGYRIV